MSFKTFCIILTIIIVNFFNSNLTAQIQANNKNSSKFENGKELLKSGKYKQANKIFSNLLKDQPENAEVHFYLGLTHARSNDIGEAVEFFKKAVSLRDTSAKYHLMYGNALFQLAGSGSKFKLFGRIKKGRKELEKVIELDAANIQARYSLMQFYFQAPGIMGGDKEKAQQLANEMIKIKPDNILSRFAKIQILISHEKLNEASNQLKKSIALCKTKRDSMQMGGLYNFLGYKYLGLKNRECDNAISCFKSYISLAPEDANAHDSLGEAYYKCGALDSSITEYEKALSIKPDFKNSKKMLKKVKKEKKKLNK